MRKERTLLFLGIWVIVLPYLGFPQDWKRVLYIITGIFLIYLAYLFYLEAKERLFKNGNHSKTFIDNIGSGE